ncbi:hypothetical protein AGMMS49960_03320 [Betaproteobacteria bacterium]|nr:hypothetical protein AGMMS49543_01580 [Betaproteobacteria bacterium]GHT99028.1 hypothetical protein AGMMS49960_03320 [Betaproteobacteria bacterium]
MAFVSERVRTEDAQKYATQQVHLHGQWTVDRENGIWLGGFNPEVQHRVVSY